MPNGTNGTNETIELDRVIERIQKLLALSTSQNPHEAALAAAKAQHLLFKHNLSLVLVEAGMTGSNRSKYVSDRFDIGGWMSWRRALLAAVAQNNFCRGVSYRGTREVGIVGEPHNVAVVKYLYTFLVREITRLADVAAGQPPDRGPESPRAWKRSFYQGAVLTIAQRLAAQRRHNAEADPLSTALVIRKDQELDQAYRQYFPNVKKGRDASKPRSANGYHAGIKAARSIALNPVIEEPRRPADQRHQGC